MYFNPCDDHPCDGCSVCQAGVCCGTLPSWSDLTSPVPASTITTNLDVLRDAVHADASTQRRLPALIRAEAAQRGADVGVLAEGELLSLTQPALPSASSSPLTNITTRKEPHLALLQHADTILEQF